MAKVIIILVSIALTIFLLYVFITHYFTSRRIIKAFVEGNVIVSGRKRYGKDILFQYVIKKRDDQYFANYSYGGDYNHIDAKELELTPNTYNEFIKGEVVKLKKDDRLEGKDIYFSDGGIIFPSQADSTLHKYYPSLPITYALTGHLWNNGIHVNTQRLERLWKALREQADYFVLIRKRRLILPFFIVVFTTEYEKYESAKQELSPLGSRLFNKYSKAEMDKYKAEHGFIKNGFILVPKWIIKYNTRAYHEIIFGEEAPKKKKINYFSSFISIFKKKEKAETEEGE